MIDAMREEMSLEEKEEGKGTIEMNVTMTKIRVQPEITEMIENPEMEGIEGKRGKLEIIGNAGI